MKHSLFSSLICAAAILPFAAGDSLSAAPAAKTTPAQRFYNLSTERGKCGDVTLFQRGFWNRGAYSRWRNITDQIIQVDAEAGRKLANFDFFRRNAETAFGYGDFKFAQEQIKRAVKMNRAGSMDTAVMIGLWAKDKKGVSKLIREELNTQKNPDMIRFWKTVEFFNKGGKAAKFNHAIPGEKLDSAAQLRLLRRASEIFYRAKRYEVCRDIYQDVMKNRFIPLNAKSYTALFVADPPRSADGFSRTPALYNNWKAMETRFVPYGDTVNINTDIDVKRLLKDAKQPEINPAWKTGILCAWNTDGVHLYFRCDDPKINEVINGKRDGGTLECSFRPSEDAPYNMWFFTSLPSAYDEVHIDFASPTPRYRLTEDCMKSDACITAKGLAAHTFIPWLAFYDKLPVDGNDWHLGFQRWCPGGGFTISGQVHELARMLRIQFKFTPEQILNIKRNLCRAAFNRFKNSKTLPVWKSDTELGDPQFYESELAGLVKELEDAGKRIDDPTTNINALFEKYMPQWAEFEYTLQAKRKDYLKKKFFQGN